jgi:hypothetical protein
VFPTPLRQVVYCLPRKSKNTICLELDSAAGRGGSNRLSLASLVGALAGGATTATLFLFNSSTRARAMLP